MELEEFLNEWHDDRPTVMVHTSGSTGKPKPLLVEKSRMEASARITCNFLGLQQGDTALLCMPLDYIAGKMMVVRALTCGLRLIAVKPSGTPCWDETIDFAAMVPLQVWNLLHHATGRQRLMQVRHLIIGGGAIDERLEEALKDFPNAVWSTYGMTETLSHIALRRLNGPTASSWYTPFEGVMLSQTEEGCLVIDAPAVHDGLLVTNDIVELSLNSKLSSLNSQQFRVIGRKDNVICSGGIKIQMEEVERLLRPHLPRPFLITRVPDERLGQQVVLMMEQGTEEEARTVCERVLPKYWQPRRILIVDGLPMTATGKPARAEAELLAQQQSMSGTHPHG
jgi:O-succinylbenzoic acid--CoA ligase